MSNAVAKRKAEFLAGPFVVKQASSALGFSLAELDKLDLENQSLSLSLCSAFAQSHNLKPDYSVHYNIKGQVVHTLLMQ